MQANGKAVVANESGFVKLIADAETDDLLGAHLIECSGHRLISVISFGMFLDASSWELSRVIYPHPTVSEALGEASFSSKFWSNSWIRRTTMLAFEHHEVGLTDQQVIDMYRYMLLARELDKRAWLLNRAGKIPFVVSCQGHEAAQIGAAFALDRKIDILLPYYRDLAMVLYFWHDTLKRLCYQILLKHRIQIVEDTKCQDILAAKITNYYWL